MQNPTVDFDRINFNILEYENYPVGIELPCEFPTNGNDVITDNMIVSEESLRNFNKDHKIDGVLFDFIYEFDVVNRWTEEDKDLYSSKEVYINKWKEKKSLFYFGEILLDENFRSHLVLCVTSEDSVWSVSRDLFLINVEKNRLKSITRIASYSLFEGHEYYLSTERLHDNILIQRDEASGGVVMSEEVKRELELDSELNFVIFKFDKEGLVKRLL